MSLSETNTCQAVLEALRSTRFTYATERDLQNGVSAALTAGGLAPVPEVRLDTHCRIDILVGRVGVEIKTNGSWRDVARQLTRYAEREELDALVLVTTKPGHRRVPREINGKPVTVHLAGSVL